MYAITGITGNVGGSVAHNLLGAGRSVRAVVRDIGKGNVWAERGCEVVTADIAEYSAFMESIGRGALKTRFIPSSQLKGTALAKIRFKEPLRLIDMVTSGGLTRLGTESSLASGSGYKNSQRWSRALRQHPSKPDGIYYRSRHDPARTACALFDAWADQPALLGEILDHYAFGTDL